MKKTTFVLGAAACVTALAANAQQGPTGYIVGSGLGTTECPGFVESMGKAKDQKPGVTGYPGELQGFAMFVSGFQTAYNLQTPQTCDIFAGWNNNQAESYFSRMRRAEFGVNHGMRHQYLAFYAADYAWHEDTRRMTRSERFRDLIKKSMQCGRSAAFCGYKKRKRLTVEHLFAPPSAKGE